MVHTSFITVPILMGFRLNMPPEAKKLGVFLSIMSSNENVCECKIVSRRSPETLLISLDGGRFVVADL